MTEMVLANQYSVDLGTLRADSPVELIAAATAVATPLAAVIEKQGLFVTISGRRYVKCEGWTTMGAMLGIIPREVSNVGGEGQTREAVVELVNMRTGAIVGRASAECSPTEERWHTATDNARRSMAATRATSKAFRLSFSWIMTLAGYETTPAEEIPEGGFIDVEAPTIPDTPGRMVGRILEVDFKDGMTRGKPWKRWGIKFRPENEKNEFATWLGTFDQKLADEAKVAQIANILVVITYTYDGKNRTLESLNVEK